MCRMKDLEIELQNYKQLQRDYIKLQEELERQKKIKVIDYEFRCPDCGAALHWESDIDMEGYLDEEGIISFYHCCHCQLEVEVRRYDDIVKCSCEENYFDEGDIPF